jgi:hypothetical protein
MSWRTPSCSYSYCQRLAYSDIATIVLLSIPYVIAGIAEAWALII